MKIESPQNRHAKLARSLHTIKGRRETGLFLAEGPAAVAEALLYAPGIEWIAWCAELDNPDADELATAARQAGIPVHEMTERAFGALSDTRAPQGIAAIMRIQPRTLASIPVEDHDLTVLVLHDLRDPGNVGAMIRSADALGAAAVILSGSCVDPYEPKVVRATAGSLFHLPVVEADWRQIAAWASDNNISLVATDLDAPHELGKAQLPARVGIIIGNEARGLPEEVLQDVALRIRIPMGGRAESLNAAVAAGIVLYEAARSSSSDNCIHNGSDGEK